MPRYYCGPDRRYWNAALPTDLEIVDHAVDYITKEVASLTLLIDRHRGHPNFGRISWDIYEFESHVRTIAMHFSLMKQNVALGLPVTFLVRDQMKYLVDLLEDAKGVIDELLYYGGFTVEQSK